MRGKKPKKLKKYEITKFKKYITINYISINTPRILIPHYLHHKASYKNSVLS